MNKNSKYSKKYNTKLKKEQGHSCRYDDTCPDRRGSSAGDGGAEGTPEEVSIDI
jgi:hypothetical protein